MLKTNIFTVKKQSQNSPVFGQPFSLLRTTSVKNIFLVLYKAI